ncbi:T9SS type A sorting domain-containing protein [Taibaiella helva]|uniref:T9SS type A sorting domain-containing protein n=1 Tax=Taibaiella helva TaxID=2301235 RepID=UPI0013004A76|nr:T9SS type A sorting domain-containing protein [Taibaiella helva]
MKRSYKIRALSALAAPLLMSGIAQAQAPGSAETMGGTAGSSALSMVAGDTTSSVSESLYIGAGNYQIDGQWNIYSKNIWISPEATITGTGTISLFNPAAAGGASGPTFLDGNNNAASIAVNIALHNAANLVLTDLAGPGGSWTDSAGKANLAISKEFNFAVANGNAVLGNYDMITAATATLTGYQPDRFVVTNGTGHLVHLNYTGLFIYPVGIAQGDYTPASVNNTAANTIHVMVQNYVVSVSAESGADGINRTWNIYADNAAVSAVLNLQHNMATNNASYNDAISFVTRYSATAPNSTGQTNLSQSNWQSNNPGPGTGSGTLTTGATIATASERGLSYATLAAASGAPEAYYTKSSNQVTPLPLDLISFSGQTIDCSALLSWTTAGTSGMSHFDLQKSIDGASFKPVARIAIQSSNSHYTYTDHEAVGGKRYYRLRIVSMDGKESYSSTLSLNMNCISAGDILVYPNPLNSKITIAGTHFGDQLYIADITGRTLKSTAASNAVTQVDMSDLPNGMYWLRIIRDKLPLENVKLTKR